MTPSSESGSLTVTSPPVNPLTKTTITHSSTDDPHHNTTVSPSSTPSDTILIRGVFEIPIEIVSEEEMGFFEAALAAARSISLPSVAAGTSCSTSSSFPSKAKSIGSITSLSKRRLPTVVADIEDSAGKSPTHKKTRDEKSLFIRFRKARGLSVTDITATEWCEKQMEFVLCVGKRRATKAMKAGSARHLKLEEEVITKVAVSVESAEDAWALKFLNFIAGVNQLLFEGLTRELPIIGFVEGVWMVGKIDEIRMPEGDSDRNFMLVDTKTRVRDTLPAEPQSRNGRLQLMCYKYIWDTLVAGNFPTQKFYDFFSLNRNAILSEEIRENAKQAGIPAKTLDDILRFFINTSCLFLPAHNQMLLRYELQKDNSLLSEDLFTYDLDWVKSQIQASLEFWFNERESRYAPEDERWKCRFCQFASACPTNPMSAVVATSPQKNSNNDTINGDPS
ncbi:unnamed protein product [Linum trigynum]|uniref:Exonuclease V n=1 Tax=Linum trigynum TaxID=586398 RepID=A0AAV2G0F7_9ROSI